MHKYLLILLLFIIVGLGIWSLKGKNSYPTQATNSTYTEKKHIKAHHVPLMQINSKKSTIKSTLSTQTISSQQQETILYKSLSLEEAKLNTQPRKNVTPIGAIHIASNIATVQVGEVLTLPDIEGEDYTLTVISTDTHPDDSISITAQYEDEGITYTSTITQSSISNYINLSTANGLYEIEANNATGYIYKTDTIREQMQDTSKNDFIILPIPTNMVH